MRTYISYYYLIFNNKVTSAPSGILTNIRHTLLSASLNVCLQLSYYHIEMRLIAFLLCNKFGEMWENVTFHFHNEATVHN